MGKYLIRRLVNYVVLVFIATSMAYLLAATSLNPRAHFLGRNPPVPITTQDDILNRYNLNDKTPVLERYGTWLDNLAHGNLGRDYDGGYVGANLGRRMWVSGQLLLIGTIPIMLFTPDAARSDISIPRAFANAFEDRGFE